MKAKTDFSRVPESDCIINYIADRHKKGLYTMILVTGLPGTGKSSTCIRLAELVSEKIHKENRINNESITDSLLGILKFLRETKELGQVQIIEEISVLFPSRRAMAAENVAVGRILDTCRKKQVILFTNAPIFTSIDSHVRSMAHILIETQKIMKGEGLVISKAWKLQTNPHTGKTYRHRFTRQGKDVGLFITKKPNSNVWSSYEKKKDQFLDNLYIKLEKQTQKKEDTLNKQLGIKPKASVSRPLTKQELICFDCRENRKLTLQEAGKEMGVSFGRVAQLERSYKKKLNLLGK